ncbi:hypothetical protein BDA99DRAFT_565870 [Phascolomyces articulosus]|uniref:Uncharacterized protein n=1 Tax=Phascolomyces articulosus TaxID=60185 RepID=A0AAD5P803_9FUNG|nr:hypothetical protein BDA99DRAFT_565870 [Phascolomyces articulosus]
MSSFSSKLSRVRSVKLSAFSHSHRQQNQQDQRRSPSPNPPPSTSSSTPSSQHRQQQQQSPIPTRSVTPTPTSNDRRPMPRSRTISGRGLTHHSFGETLRAMTKEAQSGEFADVFGSFFFSDKRCQNRAFFMAARLKQTLQPMLASLSLGQPQQQQQQQQSGEGGGDDGIWELMTHRLYTLNYVLFVLPNTCDIRNRFLALLEHQLGQIGDGQHVLRRGGMEVHFSIRYILTKMKKNSYDYQRRRQLLMTHTNDDNVIDDDEIEDIVERAREVIEHCLESESKLGHAERDAMYVFHGLRMGLHGSFEPRIELDDEYWELSQRLAIAVQQNKESTQPAYVNPFEDDDAIVTDDNDIPSVPTSSTSRGEVDSGFYDHFVTPARSGAAASS